jgi:hypothetical protein
MTPEGPAMFRTCICVIVFAALAVLAGTPGLTPGARHRAARHPVSAPPKAAAKKVALVDLLYEKIDFPGEDDPKTTLSEMLDKLAKKYGITFDVNEKAFKYEMLNDVLKTEIANPNALPPLKAGLHVVLERILARVPVPSGATWLLRRDRVEITSNLFAVQEIWVNRGREPIIRAEGDDWESYDGPRFPLLHIDLKDRPLTEALEAMAERADWNIVLDRGIGKEKEKTTITARLRNTPLDTAVRLAAATAGLTVVEMDNVLFVTTRDRAPALRAEHGRGRMRPGQRDQAVKPFADD